MRKFQFNLDKVLELRSYHERQAELKLGEATGKCNALHRRIEDNENRKRETFSSRKPEGSELSSYLYAEYYIRMLDQKISQLKEELKTADEARRLAQQLFLEASKKRKILESLKDRMQRNYYQEQKKLEQKALDEISSAQYIRELEDAG
jgi:flagellar FliJ protein